MRKLYRLILFIAMFAFFYSSINIINRRIETHKSNLFISDLRSQVYSDNKEQRKDKVLIDNMYQINTSSGIVSNEPQMAMFGMNRDLSSPEIDPIREIRKYNLPLMYERNPHFCCWIKVNNTAIDYPVLKHPDNNEYYLKRNFDKKKSVFGSIFMDNQCDLESSKNVLIYGHHMKNGTMFANLDKYRDKQYFEEHYEIELDTIEKYYGYNIIGAFYINPIELNEVKQYINYQNEEEFNQFVEMFNSHKFYESPIELSYDDQYLTLMTCNYVKKGKGRLCVIARKEYEQ